LALHGSCVPRVHGHRHNNPEPLSPPNEYLKDFRKIQKKMVERNPPPQEEQASLRYDQNIFFSQINQKKRSWP